MNVRGKEMSTNATFSLVILEMLNTNFMLTEIFATKHYFCYYDFVKFE